MKKEKLSKKEIIPDFQDDLKPNIYVADLEDFKVFLKMNKLTPLEKTMAIELLLHGYEFTPQYIVDLPEGWEINGRKYFVADFLIDKFKIIIETDGKIHFNEENQIKDRNKDNVLTCLGYRVFRFTWDDTMKNNEKYDIFVLIEKLVQSLILKDNEKTKTN